MMPDQLPDQEHSGAFAHSHCNVVGDARKRLEAATQGAPFDTRPECFCGTRGVHTHLPPQAIMAIYPGSDPT
jgi:hypothetical protein